jgi:hypothetical protein
MEFAAQVTHASRTAKKRAPPGDHPGAPLSLSVTRLAD